MTRKNLKLIMELIFIFIIPLVILCINCNYQNTIEYDNNGNYQSTEKHIEFNTPFTYIESYKNVINDFNLWNEEIFRFNESISIGSGGTYVNQNAFVSSFVEIYPNIDYYLYTEQGTNFYYCYYDNTQTYISGSATSGKQGIIQAPSNAYYLRFSIQNYGQSYNNNVCVNESVTWANGNYVPYGEPLILYTQTDVSGQNDIVYTIWGKLKNLIVDNLQIQDNQIVDIIITYTIIWFIMFVIWHFFYLFFDGLVHLFIDWGNKEKEKVK